MVYLEFSCINIVDKTSLKIFYLKSKQNFNSKSLEKHLKNDLSIKSKVASSVLFKLNTLKRFF